MAVIYRPDLEAACRQHIEGKRSTLYGSFFVVKGNADLSAAVDWISQEVTAILALSGFTVTDEKPPPSRAPKVQG